MRVNVYDKIPETPLDEWIEYLKTGKVKEDTRTPGLQEVKEKLRYLSMSAKERRAYDEHMDNIMVQNDVLDTARDEGLAEGLEQGLEQGLRQGLEQGRAEGVASVVKNLIRTGMDVDVVSAATGLSAQEIDIISKSMR